MPPFRLRSALPLLLACSCALLAACGGSAASASADPETTPALIEAKSALAPQPSGDAAQDGINWINYRRQQSGESVLSRNARLDNAAAAHANYLRINRVVSHEETPGNAGFSGATLADRLNAAGFGFRQTGHAYGEVIAATQGNSGFAAADELITAIYHRFVILEPMSKEAGVADSRGLGSGAYFTADIVADGLNQGLGSGNFVAYPVASQELVPTFFDNDGETPNPVPSRHQVGYPVSVHADLASFVVAQHFTIRPHGGATLPVQLLTNVTDPNTPQSAAAIIPLDVLASATTYDVHFDGTVDGFAVSRNWAFTTQ
jgi:uncharacterized protein YkwD